MRYPISLHISPAGAMFSIFTLADPFHAPSHTVSMSHNYYKTVRRYYGRVQQAVHEFLLMGPDIIKGDISTYSIQNFFDVTATVVVEGGKNMSIGGQCTKKDGDCRGKEVRDSRWNDMKTSMYLLGNSFRINQQKAPDNLPTVKAAKKFFKEV